MIGWENSYKKIVEKHKKMRIQFKPRLLSMPIKKTQKKTRFDWLKFSSFCFYAKNWGVSKIKSENQDQDSILALKVPDKNCSRWHFNILLLPIEEDKAWFFMWILCLAEDSLETSSLIFSEKQWKNIYECHLLQLWLALWGLDHETNYQ